MPRLFLATAIAWFVGAPATVARDAASDAPCATVRACQAELVRAHQAVAWQRSVRVKLERRLRARIARVRRPSVYEAAVIAGHVYGVDAGDMLAVARCETGGTFDPYTYNRSSGATGAWQFLRSTWNTTPWRLWPRTDPYVQALATAAIVRHDGGWHQWVCQP